METRSTHLNAYYRPPVTGDWQGRNDGDDAGNLRWHQAIQLLDLRTGGLLDQEQDCAQNNNPETCRPSKPRPIVLLGFACDAGVARNKGRTGAAAGPGAIRKALSNLAVHNSVPGLWDAGDITCPDGQLESAQEQLGIAVGLLLNHGFLPIVLGGGHEVTYGHYLGICRHLFHESDSSGNTSRSSAAPKLGLVNFDAHFDNREPGENGVSSGTGFYQIEQEYIAGKLAFNYLCIGIQKSSNTSVLFQRADRSGAVYLYADELHHPQNLTITNKFLEKTDRVYLSIDMDVFAQAYAPGVSAPTALGLQPGPVFFNYLDAVIQTGKLISLDIAELNPSFDQDGRTARLVAALVFYIAEKTYL